MTIFGYAKQASSITVGTFFEHIMNPSASGGGVIYTEVIELQEVEAEILEESEEIIELIEVDSEELIESVEPIEIIEEAEETLNGICEI